MRVLFACGGTAGHIYPALAMADMLKRRLRDVEIAFVGTKNGMENQIIGQYGYPLYQIEMTGLKRKISKDNLKTAYHLLRAFRKMKTLLKEIQPHIVIGTGGYVCYPVVRMAAKMKIPSAIHESNAMPGLATKWLAPHVDRVWLGVGQTKTYLSKKAQTVEVGNPLRLGFHATSKQASRKKYGILKDEFWVVSFGGSLGAKLLNETMYEIMRNEEDKSIRYFHMSGKHQTGDFDEKHLPQRHQWLRYTEDMPTLMQGADLIISRAGAMTLSEISALKKASILIPSPHVTSNHQYYNAKIYADQNAAILLCEEELTPAHLKEIIHRLKTHPEERETLENTMKKMGEKNTLQMIFDDILLLTKIER